MLAMFSVGLLSLSNKQLFVIDTESIVLGFAFAIVSLLLSLKPIGYIYSEKKNKLMKGADVFNEFSGLIQELTKLGDFGQEIQRVRDSSTLRMVVVEDLKFLAGKLRDLEMSSAPEQMINEVRNSFHFRYNLFSALGCVEMKRREFFMVSV